MKENKQILSDRLVERAIDDLDVEELRRLLKSGVKPIGKNPSMLCPITMACAKDIPASKRMEMVKLLLGAGYGPTAGNNYLPGPICSCIEALDWELLRVLLENGVDPNSESYYDDTVYDWAESQYMERVYQEVLPEHPKPEEMRNQNTWLETLIHLSHKFEKSQPVELQLLRKYGALSKVEKTTGFLPRFTRLDAEKMNQDMMPDWNMRDLQKEYTKKFSGYYWEAVEVLDHELLAWCELYDDRPWYVDFSLVWAKVLMRPTAHLCEKHSKSGQQQEKWVLGVFSRNPKRRGWNFPPWRTPDWGIMSPCDGDHCLRIYSFPPGNCHVYKMLPDMFFNPHPDFIFSSSSVRVRAWHERIGLSPEHFFSPTEEN